jgi:ribonucleoside-diphosphate reductase alpha chain
MTSIQNVTKRNKTLQPIDKEKIHKVCHWACEGIEGVSVSELELKLYPHLYEGISTDEINEQLVAAGKSLIVAPTYNYDKVCGRLISFIVRKQVYGDITPWPLKELVAKNIERGRYDPELLSYYSDSEWDEIDSFIDHSRDFEFRLAGADQMRTKYLVKDRVTKALYESFQIPYILVAAILFKDEPKKKRLEYIREFYDLASTHQFSLPTPIMAGIRTIRKQGSSCVLIDVGDSLDSIIASDGAATKYIADKAGLGINIGRLRGIGSPIRGGDAVHTGVVPFIKKLTASVKSCSQGGVRDGAVTFYYPMWHYEFPELVVLKDATLLEEHTNRSADYCVQVNKFLLNRLIKNEPITLFSPNDVPDLYTAFFTDQGKFAELYDKYEKSGVRGRTFMAQDLFGSLITQRSNTGRIYVQFVDNVNEHSPFKDPIVQSNLCTEIGLPSSPLESLQSGIDDGSEIALCTLAAQNFGLVNKPEDLRRPARIIVRALDNLLDYQEYPVKAAEEATKARRPLGVGVIGFAHFLARRGLYYDKYSMPLVDQFAEAWAFYLTEASVELAEEKGACPWSHRTHYSDGITPNMKRTKLLDSLLPHVERCDWQGLRERMKKSGIRNSTLMALMPSETSSQLSNETNGIEPPRSPIVTKVSKDVATPIVVPDVEELRYAYDWAMAQKGPRGYLELAAVFQKYADQAISLNTTYNPMQYKGETISGAMMLQDIVYSFQLGHKNLYYNNVRKPGESDILPEDDGCESGACKI